MQRRGADGLLFQEHVDHITATQMFARLTAMLQDVGVGAPGVFQSIAQDRKSVISKLVVNGLGEAHDVSGEPGRIGRDRKPAAASTS